MILSCCVEMETPSHLRDQNHWSLKILITVKLATLIGQKMQMFQFIHLIPLVSKYPSLM